jgi:hypothetical protein
MTTIAEIDPFLGVTDDLGAILLMKTASNFSHVIFDCAFG